jgi:hypothetical protein
VVHGVAQFYVSSNGRAMSAFKADIRAAKSHVRAVAKSYQV